MDKSKAKTSNKEAQSYLKLDEAEQAKAALEDIKKNSETVLGEGSTLPRIFDNISPLLSDPTSPIMTNAETLAHIVTHVVPEPQTVPPTIPQKKQTKEEVRQLATRCSAHLGVVLDPAHLEDLYHISSANPVDEGFVWAYTRGVSTTNQISATTTLSRIVKDIEAVMSKTQQYVAQGMDSNKLVSERITMQGQKLDQLVPAVGALMKAEHGVTRDIFKQEIKKSQAVVSSMGEGPKRAIDIPATSSNTPPFPGPDDIARMCATAEVPAVNIPNISAKYSGKVSWKEYNMVMSGAISKKDAKLFILGWKSRV